MGNCCEPKSAPTTSELSPTEQKAHQGISNNLIQAQSNEKKSKKLLLLGLNISITSNPVDIYLSHQIIMYIYIYIRCWIIGEEHII